MSLILSGTDGLSDVDGSAATPAIRGTDANTGIFFPAADTIAFAEGGVEAARFDSSGNLGLGTTSPLAKLEVYNSSVTAAFVPSTTSTWSVAQVRNNGTVTAGNAVGIAFVGRTDVQPAGIAAINSTTGGGTTSLAFMYVTGNTTTEGARIDSSGSLLVGNTGPANGRIDVTSNSGGTAINVRARAGNDYGFIQFKSNNDATVWGEIYGTSAIRLYCDAGGTNGVYLTSGATSWTANSDERLKENLVPIENGLSKVCSLRSVIGNFISDETKTKKPFLIAQDVLAVLPEAVSSGAIPKSEDTTEYLGVAYTEVIPLLVAAIKEQQAIIESLKARLDAANL